MKSLRSKVTTPGGQPAYKQPEFIKPFAWVTSWHDLVTRVSSARSGYNATRKPGEALLDLDPGFEERLEHDFCEQNPRLPHIENGEAYGRFITREDMIRFLVTMKNWLAAGRPIVSQEEAERRATICCGDGIVPPCPYMVRVTGCFNCGEFAELIGMTAGSPMTSKDDKLQSCGVCACILKRAKIHMPLDVMDTRGLKFPDFCWQKDMEKR